MSFKLLYRRSVAYVKHSSVRARIIREIRLFGGDHQDRRRMCTRTGNALV
jgi:hypothetical protein